MFTMIVLAYILYGNLESVARLVAAMELYLLINTINLPSLASSRCLGRHSRRAEQIRTDVQPLCFSIASTSSHHAPYNLLITPPYQTASRPQAFRRSSRSLYPSTMSVRLLLPPPSCPQC